MKTALLQWWFAISLSLQQFMFSLAGLFISCASSDLGTNHKQTEDRFLPIQNCFQNRFEDKSALRWYVIHAWPRPRSVFIHHQLNHSMPSNWARTVTIKLRSKSAPETSGKRPGMQIFLKWYAAYNTVPESHPSTTYVIKGSGRGHLQCWTCWFWR